MSASMNTGGPAFPGEEGESGYGPSKRVLLPDGSYQWINLNQGMSLRDWFAGQESLTDWDSPDANIQKFMTEALAGESTPEGGWSVDPVSMFKFEAKWRAALRYIRADAMLAAREKGQS